MDGQSRDAPNSDAVVNVYRSHGVQMHLFSIREGLPRRAWLLYRAVRRPDGDPCRVSPTNASPLPGQWLRYRGDHHIQLVAADGTEHRAVGGDASARATSGGEGGIGDEGGGRREGAGGGGGGHGVVGAAGGGDAALGRGEREKEWR